MTFRRIVIRSIFLFEHDLRANAFSRLSRRKLASTFPDHALEHGLTGGLAPDLAPWRGGRVVECTALEMRHRCKPIGGSNPSLSARYLFSFIRHCSESARGWCLIGVLILRIELLSVATIPT